MTSLRTWCKYTHFFRITMWESEKSTNREGKFSFICDMEGARKNGRGMVNDFEAGSKQQRGRT
jgi:hypothetical protein